MKTYRELAKKHSDQEMAASLVFPSGLTPEERESGLAAFRRIRKKIADKQTPRSRQISLLLQLKFTIEDYVYDQASENILYDFGFFLKEYIERLEKKNKEFAQEIDVDPAELSQVINRHRKPTEKLIYRLEIHSNHNFPAILWFRILEKDREKLLSANRQLIDKEKKHVKHKLAFSI
jgi:hypothetical protein